MWFKSNINIEKLELLEKQSNRAYYITQRHGNMWNLNRFDHPRDYRTNNNPWNLAIRIIEHNIGKSFDLAFSYYCKKVKVWHQYKFLDQFRDKYGRVYNNQYNDYIVDNNGLIQRNPNRYKRKKHKIYLYTEDYKEDWVHKIHNTPKPRSEFFNLLHKYPGDKYDKDMYKFVVVSGSKIEVTKKNPAYKRAIAEKNKAIKKSNKEEKINRKIKQYNLLTKSEIKNKINKQENDLNILRHGFDLETSFRSRKTKE